MININAYRLQYFPLVLHKNLPEDFINDEYTLKCHIGDPTKKKNDDRDLPHDSILYQASQAGHQPHLCICITMYNEPFIQVIESLAGIYRAYYELLHWDSSYKNKVHVVLVADGYDKLTKEFLRKLESVGLFNAFDTAEYMNIELSSDKTETNVAFKSKFEHLNHKSFRS